VRYGFKIRGSWITCSPCNKRGYWTRRLAKESEKRLVRHQGDKASKINVYRCPHDDQFWHVGHNTHQENR